MMRTRLRGLEIAGIQMGIEVPENYDWQWPDNPVAEYVCLPREPEVHVGVRVSEISSSDLGGECYGIGAWTFEVASRGDDWLLGLSRRGVRAQLATFDRDFRNGEVLVSRDTATQESFPLRTPLDEWIVLHRTVARGGLCLNGSAHRVAGQSQIRLGCEASKPFSSPRSTSHRVALFGRETVLLREEGARIRNFSTPWDGASDVTHGHAPAISEFIGVEESARPYRECLDPAEAAELLVSHAVVPLCDENLLDRVLRNARNIAEQARVVRCGELAEPGAPIAWQSAHLQNAFAPPSSGL
jgi:hypothetical protein